MSVNTQTSKGKAFKRLIVCCDGTWQSLANARLTNVARLAQSIPSRGSDNITQIVFYDEGIGAETGFHNLLLGGVTGNGIDYHIKEAYKFLAMNYEPGDEIYLFGFSRGAFTVRSLAGFMYNCGLLTSDNIDLMDEAYERYRNRQDIYRPDSLTMRRFRLNHGHSTHDHPSDIRDHGHVRITFLGCWDTVGALGLLPNRKRYQFHDTTLSPIINYARHAIAIDEHRRKFNVTLMQPSKQYARREEHGRPQILQVLFPGDHGCVGGGADVPQGLSDGALEWMMAEAEAIGLQFRLNQSLHPIRPHALADFAPLSWLNQLIGAGYIDRQLPEASQCVALHTSTVERLQNYCSESGDAYQPSNLAVPNHYQTTKTSPVLLALATAKAA